MIRWSQPCAAATCAAALLALVACSSPAVRFHTLNSPHHEPASLYAETAGRQGMIAIGPVEIADYLDRPQLVRRDSESSITLLERDRWAGSLQSDVARVLVRNFSGWLDPGGFAVVPWETTARADSRIQVSLTRFEGTGQQTVVLDALWMLHGKEPGEVLATGREVIVEPVSGSGADATVAAMSRALAELSRRIAAEVQAKRGSAG